ncbi:hypothetical protein [Cohnella silvisoli]|uniref:Helicase XPB/Ssl2 N-terminal domain-containing protein n=1 Tax=Cohnella silvisoli TaxID=2873699 RepID=A0ABV1KN63_9BACL|nr:hypothetical protein [Cohnella silvisoli]MCD9021180.1 hypothetical protein [Cohnella silvisoli]
MNLADMLCYADIAELTRIAETYDCTCSSNSKNDLIQTILTTVQRREVMESRVGEMTGNDLRFLNSLMFENRSAYSLEELKARALGGEPIKVEQTAISKAEIPALKTAGSRSRKGKNTAPPPPPGPDESARLAISRLKKFGWLFNGFSQQTRYLYQVPEDVKTRLREVLEKRYRSSLVFTEEPPAYRDERSLIMDDIVHFLRYVRDNEIAVTADGVMYKRQIAQALELFSVNETIPNRGGWRFGYGRHFRDYPDRFSLLYDFACHQGYIVEEPERLTLTVEGRRLADGLENPDPTKLYRFWLRLYKGPIPNLTTLTQWVMRLSSDWVTVDSLYQILQPLVRSYYYDTQRDILERRVLVMLMHLGIVRWGEMTDGVSVIRITPQGVMLISGNSLAFEDTLMLGKPPI